MRRFYFIDCAAGNPSVPCDAPPKTRVILCGAQAKSKNLRAKGLQRKNDNAKLLQDDRFYGKLSTVSCLGRLYFLRKIWYNLTTDLRRYGYEKASLPHTDRLDAAFCIDDLRL